MKFFSVFVIISSFCLVKTIARELKHNALKMAFKNIAESLANQNHWLTAVVDSDLSKEVYSDIIASIVAVPHVVARFNSKLEKFLLNSSAVVSLESVESLEDFNQHTILPSTFSN